MVVGATGQEPHLDYPYWDYHNRGHWPLQPKTIGTPFFMNCQATILLDKFTALNGATGCIPGLVCRSCCCRAQTVQARR
jgi:hypothetical protein